jgi:hypothetical protein
MKKFTFIVGLAISLVSCSNLRTVSSVNNYDDAYFNEADLNKRGTYYAKNKDAEHTQAELQKETGTSSYGQTYSDRLRNFGGASIQEPVRPAFCGGGVMTPNQFGMMGGFNPYMGMGYNPYSRWNSCNNWNRFNSFNQFGFNSGFGWNDPFMGYNPYGFMYQDPYWMYYNQMYNPWLYFGGNQFNSGWNNWSGGGSSGGNNSGWASGNSSSKTSSGGFTNSGVRRNSYNTGTNSGSGRSSSWTGNSENSSSSGNSGFNNGGGRVNNWGNGSSGTGFNSGSGSSGARTNSWGSGGSSSGSSGSQSGSSGRRR